MNYEQFIAAVKALLPEYGKGVYDPDENKERKYHNRSDRNIYDDFRIEQRWLSGGTEGGNCWSDGGHYEIDPEPEPQTWPELESILETYWPDISFLQYRKHILPLFKRDHYTVYEYYGNSEQYTCKVVLLKELFDVIMENGYDLE
jgi:hypothetical protein